MQPSSKLETYKFRYNNAHYAASAFPHSTKKSLKSQFSLDMLHQSPSVCSRLLGAGSCACSSADARHV